MADAFEVFIEDAFIEPIRSVVIVDDDYPTIEEVLSPKTHDKTGDAQAEREKDWVKNPQQIMDVVSEFRSKEKKYILDIHDAQNLTDDEEVEGAAHLHQTDLLVLDYELDPSKPEDYSRSLRIARKLFDSEHFNLIIINTNKNLDEAFEKVLLGLLDSSQLPDLTGEEQACVEEAYEETAFPDDFSDQLLQAFGFKQYAAAAQDRNNLKLVLEGTGEFARANKLFQDVKLHKKYWRSLAMSAVLDFQTRTAALGSFSDRSHGVSSFRDTSQAKWIRSDRAFITFSYKPEKAPLIGTLRTALSDWRPKPSRLVLAKMSADIESQGVEMQDRALADDHSSALWFNELLQSDEIALKSSIDRTVRRHIEAMVSQVLPGVITFAERLVESQRGGSEEANNQVVKEHYRIDLTNGAQLAKAQLSHNTLVCSEQVQGWHLRTGHIFEADDDKWVCVAPLCDTVPAQISKSHRELHGDRLRFSAIKLHKVRTNSLPPGVQTNQFIFLQEDDAVVVYSIAADSSAMPDMSVFYAENSGIFGPEFTVNLSRAQEDKKTKALSVIMHTDCKVLFQLRYEYAQNFVQRFGGATTRIGLDYVGK